MTAHDSLVSPPPTGHQDSTLGPIESRMLQPKVTAVRVLRQVVVFGWSCAALRDGRSGGESVSLCDSDRAEPPTLLRVIKGHKPCP